jgi:hypothetical protein
MHISKCQSIELDLTLGFATSTSSPRQILTELELLENLTTLTYEYEVYALSRVNLSPKLAINLLVSKLPVGVARSVFVGENPLRWQILLLDQALSIDNSTLA